MVLFESLFIILIVEKNYIIWTFSSMVPKMFVSAIFMWCSEKKFQVSTYFKTLCYEQKNSIRPIFRASLFSHLNCKFLVEIRTYLTHYAENYKDRKYYVYWYLICFVA